jgi:hypothetical protein
MAIGGAAIANTRLAHGHRPYAGLNGPLWHMPMAHQTPAAIIRRKMSMSRKSLGDFGFYRLSQQSTRSIAQSFGQRIGKVTRLAQGDDGMVFHGVSILQWICGWLSPPRYAASLSQLRHQLSRITPI